MSVIGKQGAKMNRKERRNLVNSKGKLSDKAALLKNHEAAVKKATVDQTMNFCIEASMSIFVMALADEFGFGKTRIERVLTRIENNFECIMSGNLALEDVKAEIEERFNIIITAKQGGTDGRENMLT
jgi:hypothetical protein